jgi:hypothetical protein
MSVSRSAGGHFPTKTSVQNPLHLRNIERSLAEVGNVVGPDINR